MLVPFTHMKVSFVTKSTDRVELSDRVRELLKAEFDHAGRFTLLEKRSAISASKWKNFFYGKQFATSEMVDFICNRFPDRASWIRTGNEEATSHDFPFMATPPRKHETDSLSGRLKWVIGEWASGQGETLFYYLEQCSKGSVSAAQWADFFLHDREPTTAMLVTVSRQRPTFVEWVLLGEVALFKPDVQLPQVDPTDQASIARWKTVCASALPTPEQTAKIKRLSVRKLQRNDQEN